MKRVWKWIIGLFGLLALSSTASASPSKTPTVPPSKGRAAIVALGQSIGLDPAWIDWLVWVAKGESGWSIKAHNDSPGEKKASLDAFTRLWEQKRWPCGNTPSIYGMGSGGWYGQLAPYTVLYLREHGIVWACDRDPRQLWQIPEAGTLAHLVQVRGTVAMLDDLPPNLRTFLHLRALYGLPSRKNKPNEIDNPKRRSDYGDTLESAGIPRAFLDMPVPPRATLDAAIAQLGVRLR